MSTDLKVTVSGSDAGLSRVLNQVERSTRSAERAMAQYDKSTHDAWASMAAAEKQLERDTQGILDRKHQAYTQTGRAMMVMGAAAVAGLGLATKAAMDWETAWTGVLKTVDGTEAEMAVLEDSLRGLARAMPVSHAEIAKVAELAGQLGVARTDVAAFTKSIIDLGVSTNMTTEQAATDFARFTTIMQIPRSEVARLGAVIVDLGNNSETTEAEIMAMAMRISGAGNLIGLTGAEVLSFSAALSSVGIRAEAGGTAISLTMTQIAQAVDKGGESLEAYARVAGMSADQFATAFRDDAAGAINSVVIGLGRINDAGGSVFGTLDELGVKGQRQRDTLQRLAGAGDKLTASLEIGNRAWIENIALQEEAERFYGTSENKMRRLGNQVRDLAIDFGADLLPALVAVGETFANLTSFVSDMPGPARKVVLAIALLTAGVGLFGGAALIAIPKIVAFKAAVEGLEGGAMKRAGTGLIGMGRFLMGPWGLALGAATIGLGVWAAKQGEAARKVEALTATLDEQTGALTDSSRELIAKELFDAGVLDRAKRLGLNLETIGEAALGNKAALAEVNAELDKMTPDATVNALGTSEDTLVHINKVRDALEGTNGTIADARREHQLQAEVLGKTGDAADGAAASQDGLTDAWSAGAGEAGSLSSEVDALKKAFDDLSGGLLDQRQANRAVRDQLRSIREAVAAYREEHGNLDGAFKKGTESGDKFAAMLDGLAKNYQNKVTATYAATGSEHAAMKAYESSRRSLIRVARQLGMTKEQAAAYVTEVLGTPEEIKTHFVAETQQARASLESFIRDASGRTINIGVRTVASSAGLPGKVAQADGSILDFLANGGVRENHVAQIAPAGAWRVWAEDETAGEAYIPTLTALPNGATR